jgi:hypothetical protein
MSAAVSEMFVGWFSSPWEPKPHIEPIRPLIMTKQKIIMTSGTIHQREPSKIPGKNIFITSFTFIDDGKEEKDTDSVRFFYLDYWRLAVAGENGLFVVVKIAALLKEFFQACPCPVKPDFHRIQRNAKDICDLSVPESFEFTKEDNRPVICRKHMDKFFPYSRRLISPQGRILCPGAKIAGTLFCPEQCW